MQPEMTNFAESPRFATEAEQLAVYRRRTKLPAGLTEDELLCGYAQQPEVTS